MVNLTIRLSKASTVGPISSAPGTSASAGGAAGSAAGAGAVGIGGGSADISIPLGPTSSSVDGILGPVSEQSVTVSCPDHLVLSDLPVAKGIGSIPDVILVKVLGRKARRRLGDKVHFCVRCDFPIAIYGRLDPCEHIFCLTCARRDSTCYLCGERVLRIQRMEVLDGIFICGAPRCLRSFIKRQDFQLHVRETHGDLIDLAEDKERNHTNEAFDSQKGQSSETQIQASSSLAIAQSLPVQEQRTGQSNPQAPDTQSSRTISGPMSDDKQLNKPDFEHKNQQLLNHHSNSFNNIERHTRQHRHIEEEQAQPDPQQQQQQVLQPPLHQQQMQQGMMMMMPGTQPGIIPMFPPQQYPMSPYPMQQQQDSHGMQPMYPPPYQIPPPPPPPPGAHLLSPPLPQVPRPPPPLAPPPPPLMPPPPPKRGKFEQATIPPTDPQIVDPQQGFIWHAGNPGYDSNRNFGAWAPPPT